MLERVGRLEFFAALLPGFFLVCAITIAFAPVQMVPTTTLWTRLEGAATHIGGAPPLVVLLAFGAYLIGSLVRIVPLKAVERVIPPGKVLFPHVVEVRRFINTLKEEATAACHEVSLGPTIGNSLSQHVFNHWKNAVCLRSADGFRYYQSFESRSRMFAGMFWAGLVGILCAIITICRTVPNVSRAGVELMVLSLAIVVCFGSQFRRVRVQEAVVLASLFTWLVTNERKLANNALHLPVADAPAGDR
jgi:hypothetical protein